MLMKTVAHSYSVTDLSQLEGKPLSLVDIPTDFDWNNEPHPLSSLPESLPAEPTPQDAAQTVLLSECLRDGLHGVASYPSVEKQQCYLEALHTFGIKHATIGIFQGEGNVIDKNTRAILRYMRDTLPSLVPTVLCQCTPAALKWTLECKEIHPRLEAVIFMGSAPSRRLVQGWSLDFILQKLSYFVDQAVKRGIPVIGATEHTTQTPPDDLHQLIRVQVEHGAYRFAIADTIGIARPKGAYRIVRFTKNVLHEMGAHHVMVDWHGHRDMGNALTNSLMAIAAGAKYIHVVSRGVGERSGNTAWEELVLNLTAILDSAGQKGPWTLPQLIKLLSLYEDAVSVSTPEHGVLGKRYNHTTVGIHTDAILKANYLADKALAMQSYEVEQRLREMARTIYSAVDPQMVGDEYSIGISQWSG